MKTIKHPFFIVISAIYLSYYIIKQTDLSVPFFVSSYLADLLCIIIVNTFALWLIRKIKNLPHYEFSIGTVSLSVLLFSVYFEVVLPQVNNYHVADVWDVLCYLISGFVYLFWRKTISLSNMAQVFY